MRTSPPHHNYKGVPDMFPENFNMDQQTKHTDFVLCLYYTYTCMDNYSMTDLILSSTHHTHQTVNSHDFNNI